MPSFGEKLKQRREKRKITLEEISVTTKIGTRLLQALEEDHFEQLPGGIFNKGFVRAYARHVGLDEDQAVADYLEASGDAPAVPTKFAPPKGGAPANENRITLVEAGADELPRQIPWGIFAGALFLLALVLSFWSHERRRQLTDVQPERSSTTFSRPNAETSGTGTNTGSGAGANSGDISAASDANPISASEKSSDASAVGNSATPPAASLVATPGTFTIDLHFRGESWVAITADGKVTSELLEPGADRSIQARRQVVLKVGNAGGIDVRFNGEKVSLGGDFGEVRTITFGPSGIVPSAPEATPKP